MTITTEEFVNSLKVLEAVQEAIKALTERSGGVPNGLLYAQMQKAGMWFSTYSRMITLLHDAGRISVENNYIRWTGPSDWKPTPEDEWERLRKMNGRDS